MSLLELIAKNKNSYRSNHIVMAEKMFEIFNHQEENETRLDTVTETTSANSLKKTYIICILFYVISFIIYHILYYILRQLLI